MKAQLDQNAVLNWNFKLTAVGFGPLSILTMGEIVFEQDTVERSDATQIITGRHNVIEVDIGFSLAQRETVEYMEQWNEISEHPRRRSSSSALGMPENFIRNFLYEKTPLMNRAGQPPIKYRLINCQLQSLNVLPESDVASTEEAVGMASIIINDFVKLRT